MLSKKTVMGWVFYMGRGVYVERGLYEDEERKMRNGDENGDGVLWETRGMLELDDWHELG